jgi:ribose transport system ATP-binding protein
LAHRGCRTMNKMPEVDSSVEAAAPPIMALRGIRKSFGAVRALNGVDLTIRPGEVHAIVGENGAGKSTLIAIAAGVLRADAGTIEYDGSEVSNPQADVLRLAGVSVTFQHPALAPDLTVLENLQLASPALNGPDGLAEATRLLATVATEELPVPVDRRVEELTLAQRHLVEIARALSTRPKVVFFDEPTEPFQRTEIQKLFELIRTMRREGVAVVYVSHRLPEVTELADRISVMRDGEIIESRPAGSITHGEIITLIAGRPIGQAFPDKSHNVGDALLEARNLSGPGFSHVDFVVRAGEIVGLAGVEGEGQRDFLRAIAGMGERSDGSLSVQGRVVHARTATAMRGSGVGFVPDDRHAEGVFLTLSVRENLGIGTIDKISRGGVIDRRGEIGLGEAMVERLRIRTASIETSVSDLSGGNQQKVLIGREMAAEPTVLLVDEPTKGVDVGARAEIYQRLRTSADQGLAVVVCSSDGIELEGLCDRVLIFARGQIVKELTGDDVTDAAITEANLTATVSRSQRATKVQADDRLRRVLATDHFPVAILAALTAIILGVTQSLNPYFLSAFNISTMLTFLAIVIFISTAQLVTILVGAIDLSVGALAGLVVVFCSFLTPADAGPVEVAGNVLMILMLTTGYGLFQGWLTTEMRIPAIIVTLASFVGLQGVSFALRTRTAGAISDRISDVLLFPLVGIPLAIVLAVVMVITFEWILYRWPLGRRLRAVGSNPLAVHRLGINRDRHLLFAFGLSGFLTGIGGLMLAGQVGIGSPQSGTDYTLMSITAVVLGGASIAGGRGSVICTLMGAALLQSLSSASAFVNQDTYVRYVLLGVITLAAAIFFSVARRRRGSAH